MNINYISVHSLSSRAPEKLQTHPAGNINGAHRDGTPVTDSVARSPDLTVNA
jgi:hypothetical protein